MQCLIIKLFIEDHMVFVLCAYLGFLFCFNGLRCMLELEMLLKQTYLNKKPSFPGSLDTAVTFSNPEAFMYLILISFLLDYFQNSLKH